LGARRPIVGYHPRSILPLCLCFPILPPPTSSTLFPYTTLFRSVHDDDASFLIGGYARDTVEGSDHVAHLRNRRDRVIQEGFLKRDRKSTRLNSSHVSISYAVFCLKKKKKPLFYLHDHLKSR